MTMPTSEMPMPMIAKISARSAVMALSLASSALHHEMIAMTKPRIVSPVSYTHLTLPTIYSV